MIRVEFTGVSHVFEDETVALNNVDLIIEPSRTVALVGPNGAGKTTLVKHMNGLLQPTTGAVWLDPQNVVDLKPAELASKVGLVFQNPEDQLFLPTVEAEVSYGPQKLGQSAESVESAVHEALTLTGLDGFKTESPYNLSWANRKLLALASILSMESQMIIMDEPAAGLDAWGLERLVEIIRHLKEKQKTVLTISHDLDFCAENFDDMIVMKDGNIIAHGPIRDVLAQKETLARAEITAPQMVRLADRLKLPDITLDPAELIDLLKKERSHEEK